MRVANLTDREFADRRQPVDVQDVSVAVADGLDECPATFIQIGLRHLGNRKVVLYLIVQR